MRTLDAFLRWVQERIGVDRLAHFAVSLAVAVAVTVNIGAVWGVVLTLALGVAKECHDERYRYGWDWKDLAADAVGVAVGVALAVIL